jgi:hypothetical protein
MANKQSFTPKEWRQIVESVMLSGIAVSAADPSGLWGALKEGVASSSALREAKLDVKSNELILAAVAEFETSQGRSEIQQALRERFAGAHPAECVERSLDGLKKVTAILDAKAPGDAAAFKAWLCAISQKVAAASVEGAFLGFGGQRVSDSEKATLADIAKSLGTTV